MHVSIAATVDMVVLKFLLLIQKPAWMIKNGNKICKLKIHPQELRNMCISIEGIGEKICPQNS